MKHFLLKTVILLILFLIAGFLVYYFAIPQFYTHGLPLSLFFIFIVTNITHAYLLNVLKKNETKFAASFMTAKILKLMVYMLVIILWVFVVKEEPVVFMLNFLVIYLVFSFVSARDASQIAKLRKS